MFNKIPGLLSVGLESGCLSVRLPQEKLLLPIIVPPKKTKIPNILPETEETNNLLQNYNV